MYHNLSRTVNEHVLSKVTQKLRATQNGEIILIAVSAVVPTPNTTMCESPSYSTIPPRPVAPSWSKFDNHMLKLCKKLSPVVCQLQRKSFHLTTEQISS